MKRLFLILAVMMLTGCDNFRTPIEISPKVTKVDFHSHRITLTTDNPISAHVGVERLWSDLEIIDSEEGILYVGKWFKLEFYYADRRKVIVTIDENPDSSERSLIVWVSRKMDGDVAFIVQEGRPEK